MEVTSHSSADHECENDFNYNKHTVDEQQLHFTQGEESNVSDNLSGPPPRCPSSITSSFLQESGEFQWCLDYGGSREYMKSYERHPTSVFSIDENQKSYDDLSKNIDANLAEIDIETFRSEDINSILSLPAMYGESFLSMTEDLQCTSDSYSSGGKLENISHRSATVAPCSAGQSRHPNSCLTSEESAEISICKNEPLFSPIKEPEARLGIMSTDSLDYSTLEKHDLVLTCQAMKNNYTIAFEGSTTQLSDDSNASESKTRNVDTFARGTMIQSDIGFTTWSKVQKVKKNMCHIHQNIINLKSCSLPSLTGREFSLSTSLKLQNSPRSVLLYNVHSSQSLSSQDSSYNYSPQSLSLLKLYMQHKDTSHLSSSDSVSDSSSSAPIRNIYDQSFASSTDVSVKCKNMQHHKLINNTDSNYSRRNDAVEQTKELNSETKKELAVNSFYTHLPATDFQNAENNNNICTLSDNNNIEISKGTNDNEDDNSLYFEDSLMEVSPQKPKLAYASPIKEEEEPFEFSSGDETMRESKDLFGSESEVSENGCQTRNNYVGFQPSEHVDLQYMKITNVFPRGKNDNFDVKSGLEMPQSFDCRNDNHSQSTQTKFTNQKTSSNESVSVHYATFGTMNTVYVSDTFNQKKTQAMKILNSCESNSHEEKYDMLFPVHDIAELPIRPKKTNVVITKTCHNSTQIPVHIRDKGIQTSFIEDEERWKTLKEDCEESLNRTRIYGANNVETKSSASTNHLYVYYPNYSLPDLSFLKTVHSTPENSEMLNMPVKKKAFCTEKALIKRRARSSDGRCRPKSYDCESICRINPIKDWASLSILLPERVKGIIRHGRDQHEMKDPNISAMNKCVSHTENPPPLPKRSLSLCQKISNESLPCYSILHKSPHSHGSQCHNIECKKTTRTNEKRWSLQEPLFACDLSLHHDNIFQCGMYHTLNSKNAECNSSHHHSKSDLHNGVSSNHSCNVPDNCTELYNRLCKCCHQKRCINFQDGRALLNEVKETFASSEGDNKVQKLSQENDKFSTGKYIAEKEFESECPPQEFTVSPSHCSPTPEAQSIPSTEVDKAIWVKLINSKSDLLQDLQKSVDEIVSSVSEHNHSKFKKDAIKEKEHSLALFCQVLYRLLSDGLQVIGPGLFDCVSDSVWKVVQASIISDCHVKDMWKLRQEVCEQKALTENSLKFCGFIFGLLNIGLLDCWLSHLCSSVRIICKYYQPTSLLYLLTFPYAVDLRKRLLSIVEPLKHVVFNLELSSVPTLNFKHLDHNAVNLEDFERKNALPCISPGSMKKNPCETVIWSGITVYPFSQEQPEISNQTANPNMWFCDVKESKTDDLVILYPKEISKMDKKAKLLKDTTTVEQPTMIDGSADSGCSSEIFHQGNKEEVPRFQQLRQQWERLTCPEDSTSATRPLRRTVVPKKPEILDVDECDNFMFPPNSTPLSFKTTANDFSDNPGVQVNRGRRRSLIPVHKGNKGIGTRRSGSAPAERGQR